MRSSAFIAVAAASLASSAMAQLASMRATIPGSLHQCENTNLFFFDSDNSRPLTVLFLPSADVPDSARSGTVQLSDAATYNPLQVIEGITTPDAQAYDFELQLAEGAVFEVFGFLENGEGKALSLTRTVTTPLPTATNCLSGVQTTVGGIAAAATTTRSSATSSSSASSRAVPTTTSSRPTSTANARSTSTTTQATTLSDVSNQSAATASPTGAAVSSSSIARSLAGLTAAFLIAAVLL